jgi:preprotein translocase subunit SecG
LEVEDVFVTILSILFIIICPLMVAIVLIQEPKGGGLAGVLGGAGGASAFGAKTTDVVFKATIILGCLFFAIALMMGYMLHATEAQKPTIPPLVPAGNAAAPAPVTKGAAPAPAPARGASAPAAPATAPGTAPAGAPASATR